MICRYFVSTAASALVVAGCVGASNTPEQDATPVYTAPAAPATSDDGAAYIPSEDCDSDNEELKRSMDVEWEQMGSNAPSGYYDLVGADEVTIVAGGPRTGAATIVTDEPLAVSDVVIASDLCDFGVFHGRVTAELDTDSGKSFETVELSVAEVLEEVFGS